MIASNFLDRGKAARFLRMSAYNYRKNILFPVAAYIKTNNIASVRAFKSAGYVVKSKCNVAGQDCLKLYLNNGSR